MGYLIRHDYKSLIQTDNLSQIIGADYSLLEKIEDVALSEIKSYLVQKYNTDDEFTDTGLWATDETYYPSSRIYLDGTAYSSSSTYAIDDIAVYSGSVYRCTVTIGTPEAFNANKWQKVGAQYAIYHIDLTNDAVPATKWDYNTAYAIGDRVWYGTKVYEATAASTSQRPDASSSQYWDSGTEWSVVATDLPDGNSVFVLGDTRNKQMVNYMIDIVLYHLHSRIAPRNIPDLRVKRYDDAIAWLKQCAKGDHLTADMPVIQPRQGYRNRYGGSLVKQNNNF